MSPQAEPGGGGGKSSPQLLRQYIKRWLDLREKIRKYNQQDEISTIQKRELNRLRDVREDVVDDIQDLVATYPKLRDNAIKLGFRADLLPGGGGYRDSPTGDGGGGGGGNRPRRPRDDRSPNRPPNRPPRDGKDGKDGRGGPRIDGDLLPGDQGKHYHLVRYNGKTYATYTVKVGKRTVKVAWRVEPGDMKKHGFEEGAGKQITKAQFKNIQIFGVTDEIARRKGGNKHPFKKWIEEIEATQGGTSILRNKQTLGILIAGFLEKEDPIITEARIRKTKWFQNRTSYERDWEQVKTKAERQQILKRTEQDIRLALDEMYGIVGYRDHVKDKQINTWARKIASGKWDEPASAFNSLVSRIRIQAARIEGTTAWQEKQEERIAAREFANRPEEMREQLRAEAREWLGPAMLDDSTLRKWSEDLVFQRKSDADWKKFVRRTKLNLYPFIDTDTPWQEFASPYKSVAEELLGRPLEWSAHVLRQLGQKASDGTPTGTAMSFDDFERTIRSSNAFWTGSPVAHEERLGLQNFLNEMFNGVPGGNIPASLG